MRILLPVIAVLALSACDNKPTEVGPGADTAATRADKAEKARYDAAHPVKLPPSIAASRQYRCADNSLALVEWYSDDISASVRTDAKATAVRVEAPAKGGTMVGGGYTLKGVRTEPNVTFSSPAHPKPQKCHV